MNTADEIMTVTALKAETSDITTITIKAKNDSPLKIRKPGQYVMLSLQDKDAWSPPHPFTVSNAPGNDTLQLTIKRAGAFTSRIETLHPGDEVKIRGPYGTFCSSIEASNHVVMIAGGIGITPFLSVLRHYFMKFTEQKTITLFWGNADPDHFFSLAEIDSYFFFSNFTAVIVSEQHFRPKNLKEHRISSVKFEEGLMTASLLKKYADFRDAAVYICGSKAMQDFVLQQLSECGVSSEKIEKEHFGT